MPSFKDLENSIGGVSASLSKLGDQARTTHGIMAEAQRSIDGVSSSLSQLDRRTQESTTKVRDSLSLLKDEATPRINDLIFDLERMAQQGDQYAGQLLDTIRQVLDGTIRADQAFSVLGDALVLFEGQARPVNDLLAEFLPTSGQVRAEIEALIEQLRGAGIGDLLKELEKQYNQYAKLLLETVNAYQEGRVTLERVITLARQIQQLLPDSATAGIAELLETGLADGSLS